MIKIKLLLVSLLIVFADIVSAQKKYVTLHIDPVLWDGGEAILSGAIPDSMNKRYNKKDFIQDEDTFYPSCYWMGNLLNLLAKNGFGVEQMEFKNDNDDGEAFFLLSNNDDESQKNKSYVTVLYHFNGTYEAYLSGDIPSTMKNEYDYYYYGNMANILNQLSDFGYHVESMMQPDDRTSTFLFLLSKDSSTSNAIGAVSSGNNSMKGIAEVAGRYNINGIPSKDTDKGIQIIVSQGHTAKKMINK